MTVPLAPEVRMTDPNAVPLFPNPPELPDVSEFEAAGHDPVEAELTPVPVITGIEPPLEPGDDPAPQTPVAKPRRLKLMASVVVAVGLGATSLFILNGQAAPEGPAPTSQPRGDAKERAAEVQPKPVQNAPVEPRIPPEPGAMQQPVVDRLPDAPDPNKWATTPPQLPPAESATSDAFMTPLPRPSMELPPVPPTPTRGEKADTTTLPIPPLPGALETAKVVAPLAPASGNQVGGPMLPAMPGVKPQLPAMPPPAAAPWPESDLKLAKAETPATPVTPSVPLPNFPPIPGPTAPSTPPGPAPSGSIPAMELPTLPMLPAEKPKMPAAVVPLETKTAPAMTLPAMPSAERDKPMTPAKEKSPAPVMPTFDPPPGLPAAIIDAKPPAPSPVLAGGFKELAPPSPAPPAPSPLAPPKPVAPLSAPVSDLPPLPATPKPRETVPADPSVRRAEYEVNLVSVRRGDSYDQIAKETLFDAKYGELIRRYNSDRELRPGDVIKVPPTAVLRKLAGPDWVGTPAARPAPLARSYVTPRDGMSMWDIAYEVYGTKAEFRKVIDANRDRNPNLRFRAGERFVLPTP